MFSSNHICFQPTMSVERLLFRSGRIIFLCLVAVTNVAIAGSSVRSDYQYNNTVPEPAQDGWIEITNPVTQAVYNLPENTTKIELRGRALGFRTIRMTRDCYRTDPYTPRCTGYSDWKYNTYLSPKLTVTDESGSSVGYVVGDWSLFENIVEWKAIISLVPGQNTIIVHADYVAVDDDMWPYEDVFEFAYNKGNHIDQIVINVPP